MSAPAEATLDPSLVHLFGRVAAVELRIHGLVRRRMEQTEVGGLGGLGVSEEEVRRLLAPTSPPVPDEAAIRLLMEVEAAAAAAESRGTHLRLRRLGAAFGLSPLDVDLFVVALLPDLDTRFERLYGYLNDDVTRPRASVRLALELCGVAPHVAAGRRRLRPGAPLVDNGLVEVEDAGRPFLTRSLRVPDRVGMHVLGDSEPDPEVAALRTGCPRWWTGDVAALAGAISDGVSLVYLREAPGAVGRALAAAACAMAGLPVLPVDLARVGPDDDVRSLAAVLRREAGLQQAVLVAGPVDALADRGAPVVRALAELLGPVVLTGTRSWDPAWSRTVPLVVPVAPLGVEERRAAWAASLNGGTPADLDIDAETATFRLAPEQIERAARAAALQASHAGHPVQGTDLRAGARSQNAAGLERLSQRVEPRVGWDDLVLPADVLRLLKELFGRARWAEIVLDDWGLRRRARTGGGLTALFAGAPGTGKTMAAEVLARELGLDLYVVDLARVVDKYVGETEKNLERVFDEAERVCGVLLFDEADALFGKRSDVRDAHDRYANIETAYLLQRMETFRGTAILATNLRSNLDDAFSRRLDVTVDFPLPDEPHRLRLWERLFTTVPLDGDVDLPFCARAFELSGGSIRNVALTASFFAAEGGPPVLMHDVVRAVQREYQKLGRLCVEAEFGDYYQCLVPG